MESQIAQILGLWTQVQGPLYLRLVTALRRAISAGEIAPQTRLPAERVLAETLQISRTTVVAAYHELEAEGWIERRQGSGTRVSPLASQSVETVRAHHPGKRAAQGPAFDAFLADHVEPIDLATGAVDWPTGLNPTPYIPTPEELAPLLTSYGYMPQGLLALRQAVADTFVQQGIPTAAENILITTGAQQAIHLIASCFLQRGEEIYCETPTFFGAIDIFRMLGLHCISFPVEMEGSQMESAQRLMQSGRARWLYLTPTIQNPTGTSLSPIQRRQLVQSAQQAGVSIIEDLTMGDLQWGKNMVPPLAVHAPGGEVLSIGSLSKVVWAGFRVGWIRASTDTIARLARWKTLHDLGSSLPGQLMALRLFADRDRLLQQRHQELQDQQALMEEYLAHYLASWSWQRPQGGLFLWLRLPHGDARVLAQEALRQGVLIMPGSSLSVDEGHIQYVRLAYVRPAAEVELGISRLAQAWQYYEESLHKNGHHTSVIV